ncbi:hypothetical protein GCM10010082_31690 [Kushneria pakistanensis]|uniref:Uncharacterized protein n=1 Tax=Kushneria pakistanensis TaxID=1508770 RepID=A0ABQ3FQX4_9GAMM|nr:hypothetical protein [Kushneria pakistanensis]GHC34653.1 hypothetical protein GCM10010082_31690 [Kushneria pakistanensis]
MARRLNRFTERAFAMASDSSGWLLPPNGDRIPVDGIFDNAVLETSAERKGTGRGGLTLNRRRPIFTVPSSKCRGISTAWQVEIVGVDAIYYVADHHPDGQGFMTLWLANSDGPPTQEGDSDGPGWR